MEQLLPGGRQGQGCPRHRVRQVVCGGAKAEEADAAVVGCERRARSAGIVHGVCARQRPNLMGRERSQRALSVAGRDQYQARAPVASQGSEQEGRAGGEDRRETRSEETRGEAAAQAKRTKETDTGAGSDACRSDG